MTANASLGAEIAALLGLDLETLPGVLRLERLELLPVGVDKVVVELARMAGVPLKRCNDTRRLFYIFTMSQAYLERLADPDSMRFDLAGRIDTPVSDEHRAAAIEALRELARATAAHAVV
jgi:hypothetical protein